MYKKAKTTILPGTVIRGKWNHGAYTVIREIGSGTVGTVYVCRMKGKLVALKLSDSPISLTREVAVLKSFNKVRDQRLGPFLFDVDDWESGFGEVSAFYVMEYIQGVSLEQFVKNNGKKWIGLLVVQLLEILERLHREGVVFGDLKNENLLIAANPPTVRLIDVGGVTKMGQSIKEYSAFYDRAYWQLGTRKAEPSYDLFAVVMVLLSVYYPKQFKRSRNSKSLVLQQMQSVPALRPFQVPLKKAIIGSYSSAKMMKHDVAKVVKYTAGKTSKKRDNLLPQAFIIAVLSGVYYLISLFFYY